MTGKEIANTGILTRRNFLKATSLAAATTLIGGCTDHRPSREQWNPFKPHVEYEK
jgi:hypothetical protein